MNVFFILRFIYMYYAVLYKILCQTINIDAFDKLNYERGIKNFGLLVQKFS